MIFTLVMFAILIGIVAFTFSEGLWTNVIMFFNVVTAALLAMNFWEPLSDWVETLDLGMTNAWWASFTYVWDVLLAWGVFVVAYGVLRIITDLLSEVRVKFIMPLDVGGGLLFSALSGWVFLAFVCVTLNMAPLSVGIGYDEKPKPGHYVNLPLEPDHAWLAFTHALSLRAYSRSTPNAFDPDATFLLRYADRRTTFEKEPDIRVNRAKKPG